MKSVYSAVQTGSLNKAVCTLSLKGSYWNNEPTTLEHPTDLWLMNYPCSGKVPSLLPTVAINIKVKIGVHMMN
jgi:hypothetical protein